MFSLFISLDTGRFEECSDRSTRYNQRPQGVNHARPQHQSTRYVLVIFLSVPLSPVFYLFSTCVRTYVRTNTGKLPEGATKLLSLETLNLSDTLLDFLPANFGRLTKLRHLELRENQLATLPKSMARLIALKRLDVGQNDLCDLPDVIGSIPSLEELWIDGNKLDVLPDFLGQLPVGFFTVYFLLMMRSL